MVAGVQAVAYRLRTTRAATRVPTTLTVRPCRAVCSCAPPLPTATLSRRRAGQLLLSVATPVGAGELGAAAAAAAVVQPADAAQARAQLLSVIRGGGDEAAVQAAIEWLAPFNPTSAPARSPELQGEWRLLWSSATAEVTKDDALSAVEGGILGLPAPRDAREGGGGRRIVGAQATKDLPLPFESVQLVGPGGGMEAGRAANLVRVLGGAVTLKLSSSAVPDAANDAAVTIGPPFRLELLLLGKSIPLQSVETTESETTDILGNQLNEFSQLYLETAGTGDLRVSKVTNGDPVVVGSTFVHVRV